MYLNVGKVEVENEKIWGKWNLVWFETFNGIDINIEVKWYDVLEML